MLTQARALQDELVRLRRDIHQHPELSFQEVRTAKVVADTLTEIGYSTVRTQVGRTGVTAEIGPDSGPIIGIRADMDALPIQEALNTPYRSQNEGVMHACGHDAHTAILLGVAHLLQQDYTQQADNWQGRVRLIFQPAEEAFDAAGISGATAMIQDGALEGVDHVIALHVISNEPSGVIHLHDGFSLASVDSFEAWVRGSGGHGAYPHKGSDPLYMLSAILPMIYGIPSRRIDPLAPCVVSLGEIRGGSAPNVIPGEVYVQGTIRSMDNQVRQQLWAEIEQAFALSKGMGGSYAFELHKGYPSLYNDLQVNSWLRETARDLAGDDAVQDEPFGMGAEDFSYMAAAAPGAMFNLGAQIKEGVNHHTAEFDIDENVLSLGAAILAETARRYVTRQLTTN